MDEVVEIWSKYLATVADWESIVEGIEPKVGGCGIVYELPNPIERPHESFAIADMRQLKMSEPHKHTRGETEIYIVIQGVGKIVVGSDVYELAPARVIVTPPDTVHIVLPGEGLVLAVVNSPPFNVDNYVIANTQNPAVSSAMAQLRSL